MEDGKTRILKKYILRVEEKNSEHKPNILPFLLGRRLAEGNLIEEFAAAHRHYVAYRRFDDCAASNVAYRSIGGRLNWVSGCINRTPSKVVSENFVPFSPVTIMVSGHIWK